MHSLRNRYASRALATTGLVGSSSLATTMDIVAKDHHFLFVSLMGSHDSNSKWFDISLKAFQERYPKVKAIGTDFYQGSKEAAEHAHEHIKAGHSGPFVWNVRTKMGLHYDLGNKTHRATIIEDDNPVSLSGVKAGHPLSKVSQEVWLQREDGSFTLLSSWATAKSRMEFWGSVAHSGADLVRRGQEMERS